MGLDTVWDRGHYLNHGFAETSRSRRLPPDGLQGWVAMHLPLSWPGVALIAAKMRCGAVAGGIATQSIGQSRLGIVVLAEKGRFTRSRA